MLNTEINVNNKKCPLLNNSLTPDITDIVLSKINSLVIVSIGMNMPIKNSTVVTSSVIFKISIFLLSAIWLILCFFVGVYGASVQCYAHYDACLIWPTSGS